MKVLFLAILCLLSHTKARHLLIETEDSDVNLEATSDETFTGVGEEDVEKVVKKAAEGAMEEAMEEGMEEDRKEGKGGIDFFPLLV